MSHRSEHLRSNRRLRLDYLLGLRAFGLVIYGALPASLGALGAFKPPDQTTLSSKIGIVALPYIIAVALIPVVLTYVLVRQRLSKWYLLSDYLIVRSIAITVAIIVVSSLVCGANGLLVGTFKWITPSTWSGLSYGDIAWPIGVCLLLSFAYLVGSNTLFLTVVKEDGNLPLLPPKTEIDNLDALRDALRKLKTNKVGTTDPSASKAVVTADVTELTESVDKAKLALETLKNCYNGLGRQTFQADIQGELASLKAAALDVSGSYVFWAYYWDPKFSVKRLNRLQLGRRNDVERLNGLFGGV